MRDEYDFSEGERKALIPLPGKTRVSIFIDDAVLEAFRARAESVGSGYEALMNEALRWYLAETEGPAGGMKREPIPQFTSEEEERKYWSRTDSADHVDWSKAEAVILPELRRTSKSDLGFPVESSLEDLEGAQRLADEEDEEDLG